MPEQSCKCQLGQQMAVTAVGVWDRGSRWGTEKQVSPPSWTSPGTGPHLYSGQPWSWKLVRGEETPSTSLLLLASQMFCCVQSLLRCHFARAEHHAEKRGWGSREVARLLPSLQASICISVLENLTCPDQECPQALFVGTPQGADSPAVSQGLCLISVKLRFKPQPIFRSRGKSFTSAQQWHNYWLQRDVITGVSCSLEVMEIKTHPHSQETNREGFRMSTIWFQKSQAYTKEKKRSIRNFPPEKWATGQTHCIAGNSLAARAL